MACLMSGLASAQTEPTIGDFLYNLGTGPMAANEIIKLDGSAVSNVQAAKDLVIALGSIADSKSKDGFGIAFTPGRSRLDAVAVSLANYSDANRVLSRIWGNTTFSYAQNKLSKAGADYARSAVALNVSLYLSAKEDPIVAARDAITADIKAGAAGACSAVFTRMLRSQQGILALGSSLRPALAITADGELPLAVIQALSDEANNSTRTNLAEPLANHFVKALEAQQRGAAPREEPAKLAADLKACADKAQSAAKTKWNASQATIVLGQGWIKASTGADPQRLSLGRHATAAVALGSGDNGLFNLTLRGIRREINLDTLAKTPEFTNTSIAAARYTYGQPGRETYGLAELSNVKKNSDTLSNAAFKYALGIDHKLTGGLWMEFRYGRSRVADGTKLENKALFNLKFSPESTLDKKL